MELMSAIRSRRAVRNFSDVPVEASEIEKTIEAATEAPSAMNLQPWAFAVLTDRRRIDEYAGRARAWMLEQPESLLGKAAREILERPDYTIFYHAPVLLLVLAKSSETQAREDCCLAAQNLMLAARDQGLGTCWIGFAVPWLNLPATKRELALTDNYYVVGPIVMGYPKAWPDSHGRKAAEIHWLG